MDKQPATLIDQQPSSLLPPTGAPLNQWQLMNSLPWFQPVHVVATDNGPWGVPYWMQGIALQTCNFNYITAPTPLFKSQITHAVGALYTAGQYGAASAPTAGVYTGVEDSCP